MPRYIDADALVRAMALQANRTSLGEICPPNLSYSEMLDIIADAPTADVAPREEVAKEILNEVRQAVLSLVLANAMGENFDLEKRFSEIEKKYTGETDTNDGHKAGADEDIK